MEIAISASVTHNPLRSDTCKHSVAAGMEEAGTGERARVAHTDRLPTGGPAPLHAPSTAAATARKLALIPTLTPKKSS